MQPTQCINQLSSWYGTTFRKKSRKLFRGRDLILMKLKPHVSLAGSSTNSPFRVFLSTRGSKIAQAWQKSKGVKTLTIWVCVSNHMKPNSETQLWFMIWLSNYLNYIIVCNTICHTYTKFNKGLMTSPLKLKHGWAITCSTKLQLEWSISLIEPTSVVKRDPHHKIKHDYIIFIYFSPVHSTRIHHIRQHQ